MLHRLHNTNFNTLPKDNESPSDSLSVSSEGTKFGAATNKNEKPKRNRSAFIIFSSEMRSKMKAEEKKKLNSNEMMVKLADLWKNLHEDERKRYHDMANKEKIKYLLELNQFYQTHPYDVIQNKTKKNHVKKPCSAYGLFLKETKKTVKAEHPELKMADVLKIVADRWKKLSESQRAVYQEQAKKEKEVTKAKIDEYTHSLEDDQNMMALPQKRLQSQKRVKKALMRENLKLNSVEEDVRAEEVETSDSSPFEEVVFIPKTEAPAETDFFQNFSNFADENFLQSFPSFNLNFNRMPSIDPIFQAPKEIKEEPILVPTISFKPEPELKAKKSNDFLTDLLNFHSRQETFENKCSMMINKTSSNFGQSNNTSAKTSRQVFNDALLNVLNFEPSTTFDLDFLHFDTSMSEMKF